MFIKKLLPIFLLVTSFATYAQTPRNQAAFQMLKTATTLVEAQQFDAAEEYFKQGLAKAKTSKDVYCQAFAYEGLGNLYTKTDQQESAVNSYKNAIKLYRSQGLNVIANVVESLLKSVQGIGDLYAGVEIGAKGIKLIVLEVKLSKEREYTHALKLDTSINTDAASLSYQSEKETSEAIAAMYNIIKNRYQVAPKRTVMVISSGLKQELDKYNKIGYFAEVIRPKDMDAIIKIDHVTAEQEAELSFMGIVPQKHRFTANQLDIGSGNTKGGYFDAAKRFVPVTFSLGTKSFQRLIETKNQGNLNEFLAIAEQTVDDSLVAILATEIGRKKELKSRDIIYLSGGIVWAIASLMHPESINNTYTEISSRDVSDFRQLIYAKYETVTKPDITLISNAEVSRTSMKNINRVLKTYDQRAMLAGAIWLDELIKQVNIINPDRKFIYSKYAYVGWISGYIMKKATQQYTGMAN